MVAKFVQTALRPAASLLRQVTLSIAATLIASAVLSSLGPGWTLFRPGETEGPALTSGGKFAARVESLAAVADEANPLPTLVLPAPLLVADGGWGAPTAVMDHAAALAQPVLASASTEPGKSARHLVHAEPKRRTSVDSAAVVPPRRSDYMAEATPTATPLRVETGELSGLWSSTKGWVGQAESLSVTLLDKVTPSSLLP